MREIDLGRRFSLIFVARNSLLHLSEQDEFASFFASARRQLEPNGLAFESSNSTLVAFRPAASDSTSWAPHRLPRGLTVEATKDYDRHSQVNRAICSYLRRKNVMTGWSHSIAIYFPPGAAGASRCEPSSPQCAETETIR